MFRTQGKTIDGEDYVNMSFRDTRDWLSFGLAADRQGSDDVALNLILIGDEETGPALFLTHAMPGIVTERAVSHGHASDNWRISLLGEMHVGPDTYGPGEFRLQEGWKIYPDDDSPRGPEGGWGLVMMADRRGTRRRLAVEPVGFEHPEERYLRGLADIFGFAGDVFSDDPELGSGPSAIASTIGGPTSKLRMGKLNGAFADSDTWDAITSLARMAVTLMGDREKGPVLVFTDTQAGACAAPRSRFDTEALHLIIEGGCKVGGETYRMGDMRIQAAGTWCEPIEALDEGLKEVILFGDRRYLGVKSAEEGWPVDLPDIVAKLRGTLDARAETLRAKDGPARVAVN